MATNSQIAFNPQGKTVVIAAAVAPPLGVQVARQVRLRQATRLISALDGKTKRDDPLQSE